MVHSYSEGRWKFGRANLNAWTACSESLNRGFQNKKYPLKGSYRGYIEFWV